MFPKASEKLTLYMQIPRKHMWYEHEISSWHTKSPRGWAYDYCCEELFNDKNFIATACLNKKRFYINTTLPVN